MNPKFLPTTTDGKIARLGEESGEVVECIGRVMRVAGKINRFGLTSHHPKGGANNAADLLSELADLKHAISAVENSITDHAFIKLDNGKLIWTNELVSAAELRDLYLMDSDDQTVEDFLSENKVISVCDGQWHREALEYRFYRDPERADVY